MSDEDSDDQNSLGEIIQASVRPWNSFWTWKNKPTGERGAAHDILTGAGMHVQDLVSRGNDDPPDCEGNVDGCVTGIEVTELVHQPMLERSLKALKQRALGREPNKAEAYFIWDRAEFLRTLQARIDDKDQAKLKGGPYERYILVIHTDEMFLEAAKVEQWLTGVVFRASLLTDVLLGLSYDPDKKCCPIFKMHTGKKSQTIEGER